MVRPVLLAVDDDPAARSSIEAELRKRYGADYEVICEGSGAAALATLERVTARNGQVALVVADLRLPDMTGIELLTKVRVLEPAAKRALLTGWGDLQVGDRLVRAAVLGQVDDWGLKPWQPGDEGFHQLVVGLLYEWAQLYRPGFQAVQVVGEQWSARAHELRDVLARNRVLYGFLPADSEEGRALLKRVGATTEQLPVVVTFDGRVLRDPSFAEVAEALSAPTRPAAAAYDVTVVGAGPAGLAAAMYGSLGGAGRGPAGAGGDRRAGRDHLHDPECPPPRTGTRTNRGRDEARLGGRRMIQYGRTAMRMQRQHSATRVFLVLAMVLASLGAGALASSVAGGVADQLAASRSRPGLESAAPRDRVPALRPPDQRPSQSGRLLPLLLGMLAGACALVYGVGAGRLRSGLAAGRSLVQLTQLAARAPPSLQSA